MAITTADLLFRGPLFLTLSSLTGYMALQARQARIQRKKHKDTYLKLAALPIYLKELSPDDQASILNSVAEEIFVKTTINNETDPRSSTLSLSEYSVDAINSAFHRFGDS